MLNFSKGEQKWVCNSVGRVPDLHSGSREFEPLQIHHLAA